MVVVKERMMQKLEYSLNNPACTIYHRAALGGLAATIHSWEGKPPEGINATITPDKVSITWDSDLSDREALKLILQASFRLNDLNMIDLPGQGIPLDRDDLRLAIHNGITQTFLQHHTSRPGPKEPKTLICRSVDDDDNLVLSYKPLDSYAHQYATGTGLFDEKGKGQFPFTASIPQSIIPGAFKGAQSLDSSPENVILLLFLLVGCSVFHLRPRVMEQRKKTQYWYCVVIPDVRDLVAFSKSLRRISKAGTDMRLFSNTYLGRVVGGAEEAALRFLLDLQAAGSILGEERSISSCQAVGIGQVAWDKNQVNRRISIRIRDDYDEIEVFRAANQHLGQSKVFRNEQGESFVIPASALPELIAANLAAERHWCSHFREIVSKQADAKRLLYRTGGLAAMNQAVNNVEDKLVIKSFQEAWRRNMAAIYDEYGEKGYDAERRLETEREKARNDILRTKTTDALAGWYLRFIADATKGGSLASLKEDSEAIRQFIFNPRNFDRFQNLCLFALLSYQSKSSSGEQ